MTVHSLPDANLLITLTQKVYKNAECILPFFGALYACGRNNGIQRQIAFPRSTGTFG